MMERMISIAVGVFFASVTLASLGKAKRTILLLMASRVWRRITRKTCARGVASRPEPSYMSDDEEAPLKKDE